MPIGGPILRRRLATGVSARAGGRRFRMRCIATVGAKMKKLLLAGVVASAITLIGSSAYADTFAFTSCRISGSACQGGSVSEAIVDLTQVGTNATFDVTLLKGNWFVETGAGGGGLFLF